jgi:hypothetical protein
MARMTREGRNVSHTITTQNYAPKLFAAEPEAKAAGLRKANFENAMRRLFANRKIIVQTYGKYSRQHERLVTV